MIRVICVISHQEMMKQDKITSSVVLLPLAVVLLPLAVVILPLAVMTVMRVIHHCLLGRRSAVVLLVTLPQPTPDQFYDQTS